MSGHGHKPWRLWTPEDRFWLHVGFPTEDGCWPWTGSTNGRYGIFHHDNYTEHYAHRFAYKNWVAPIPPGLVIDHLCCNTRCVNPAHLDPVTQSVNLRRGWARIAAARVNGNAPAALPSERAAGAST